MRSAASNWKSGRLVTDPSTLHGKWKALGDRQISLHETPCIVTSPPGRCDGLVNPANELLQGTLFTPSECARYLLSETIIYPPQAIDGIVTELGGAALADALLAMPMLAHGRRCPTGSAVTTPAYGELLACFTHIVHACAPFYGSAEWRDALRSCYHAAFDAADDAGCAVLAVPLLGAGARGAPAAEASRVAAEAAAHWMPSRSEGSASASAGLQDIRFGTQQPEVAQLMLEELDAVLARI